MILYHITQRGKKNPHRNGLKKQEPLKNVKLFFSAFSFLFVLAFSLSDYACELVFDTRKIRSFWF